MHIYSLELLSELNIGDSLVVEIIANGMYVVAILLMIYVAGESRK
jgi:pyridoxine 5'-phosphate synthase PdxJ